MEERQVTMDGKTYPMAYPFIVLATQNPIEQEGTYRLPEAQLDRFLFKIEVNYPTLEEENQIIAFAHDRKGGEQLKFIKPVLSAEQIQAFRQKVKEIHIDANLMKYIAQLVHQTRSHPALYLGASPRASLAILNASKAYAAMQGRDFVTPEDIKYIAPSVLRHRIMLTPEKEMEGTGVETVIKQMIDTVEVPR
ncbi:MAG: MoxR family ATPase, partial [Verrucomicrobia bacterium]|nr:MoxR family ATPase [Cytophagales bacterium]